MIKNVFNGWKYRNFSIINNFINIKEMKSTKFSKNLTHMSAQNNSTNNKITSTYYHDRLQKFSFHGTKFLKIKNYYKILNITPQSSESDVKKAFLILAKKFHPDINKSPGAKEKFADILEAYDVLSDKNKKKIYDKSGLTASEQEDLEYSKFKESEFTGTFGTFTNEVYLEDNETDELYKENNFENLINSTTDPQIYKRINEFYGKCPVGKDNLNIKKEIMYDIITDINVSLMESIEGCTKTVTFNRCYPCEECTGEFCFKCYGKGYKLSITSEKIDIPCVPSTCNENSSLVLKFKNKGNSYIENNIFKNSDLYVKINVDDHDYFKREGDNIITNYYITISQAVLGTELKIRTLHGIKHVKLRRYKDKVVLINEGINKKGKHIVKVYLKFPSVLCEEQEKIFRQISEFEKLEKIQKEKFERQEKFFVNKKDFIDEGSIQKQVKSTK